MDMHKNCNYVFILGLASANILVYSEYSSLIGVDKMSQKIKEVFMKYHKFFAWAAVICMILAIITGYKKE